VVVGFGEEAGAVLVAGERVLGDQRDDPPVDASGAQAARPDRGVVGQRGETAAPAGERGP
jgi:hypothetical protein